MVPVSNAEAIERLVKSSGGSVQSHIYPGEGHRLSLASWPDAIARTQAFHQAASLLRSVSFSMRFSLMVLSMTRST